MPIDWNVTVLAALGVGLRVGVGVGVLLRERSGSAARTRAEQLESELGQTREELEAHREDVARHFQETSDLFRGVTEQYSRLYTHLAAGARTFSTDGVPALGALETPLLGREDAAPPESAATPAPGAESDSETLAAAARDNVEPSEQAVRERAQGVATAPAAPRAEAPASVKPNGGLGAAVVPPA